MNMGNIAGGAMAALLLCGICAAAQEAAKTAPGAEKAPSGQMDSGHSPKMPAVMRTFYLTNAAPNDGNEILTAIRLLDPPDTKLYLAPSVGTITVAGTAEEVALAERLIKELDHGKKEYKLTYTFTESDAGKKIGVQHLSLVVAVGGRTTLKNGSRVPVTTGSYNTSGAAVQTQFTYLDIGTNIDASLDQMEGGARLRSKVEQSSVEESTAHTQDPVVRQSVLEGTSFLTAGKPDVLGTLDIAGSTRHLEIEVVMEPVK
jgi:type II secretory pathway component GspD/PulD (secretin)